MSPQTIPGQVATFYTECVQAARHGSGEHAAIAVLLGHPIAHTPHVMQHVDASGIDWDAIFEEPLSESEEFLLRTAASLWGRGTQVNIGRVAWLSEDQYTLFQDMLKARMTGRIPRAAGS